MNAVEQWLYDILCKMDAMIILSPCKSKKNLWWADVYRRGAEDPVPDLEACYGTTPGEALADLLTNARQMMEEER